MKKTIAVSDCCGADLLYDAYAVFNDDTNRMELHSTYDDTTCEECGSPCGAEDT